MLLNKNIYLLGETTIHSIRFLISEIENANAVCDLIINSPGGEVEYINLFIDYLYTLGGLKKISSVCVWGECSSAAALLWLSFPIKKRYMFQHGELMFHYPKLNLESRYISEGCLNSFTKQIKNHKIGTTKLLQREMKLEKKKIMELLEKETIICPYLAIKYGILPKKNVLLNNEEKMINV